MLFEIYLKRVNTILHNQSLWKNELEDALFPGADDRNFSVTKNYFGELSGPLNYLFNSSLQSGAFLGLLKTAVVSLAFKIGNTADISYSCLISVLPCFSKMLERLYKYLTDWKILHPQELGLQKSHYCR